MKKIFLGMFLFVTGTALAAAPSYSELKGFVNDETVVAINILNRMITKLNITACSQINSRRPADETTIRTDYTEVGLWDEFRAHGPESSPNCTSVAEGGTDACDGTWDGVVNNFSVKLTYSEPSLESKALGLEKRVKLYTQNGYTDNGVLSQNVSAIIEFSCDMKKGHYFQTGSDTLTHADMMEVYWDNTSTPVVEFKYAGPVRNTPVYYTRNSNDGKFTAAVITTGIFASLADLLSEFGISNYTINVDTGVATAN